MADLGMHGTPGRTPGVSELEHYRRLLDGLPPEFSTVWISDHMQFGDDPTHEAWTMLTYLASRLPEVQGRVPGPRAGLPEPGAARQDGGDAPGALERPPDPRARRRLARGGVPRLQLRVPAARRARRPAGGDDPDPEGDVDAVAGDLPRGALPDRRRPVHPDAGDAHPGPRRHERAEGACRCRPPCRRLELGRSVGDVSSATRHPARPLRGHRPAVRGDLPRRRADDRPPRRPGDLRVDLSSTRSTRDRRSGWSARRRPTWRARSSSSSITG